MFICKWCKHNINVNNKNNIFYFCQKTFATSTGTLQSLIKWEPTNVSMIKVKCITNPQHMQIMCSMSVFLQTCHMLRTEVNMSLNDQLVHVTQAFVNVYII